jgi:DNA-binding response OmpR family regulator
LSAPGDERPLVLVADNDADILALVEYRLQREGFAVVRATDGEAALRVARERLPDIAIMDVRMPTLDGYEVVREMRRDAALSEIPVVMLSASVRATDAKESLEAGANDHLGKPFSSEELIRCVRGHLGRRGDRGTS